MSRSTLRRLALVAAIVLAALPAAAAPRSECGGFDTTEYRPERLSNGERCDGAVNNCDDTVDHFEFTATGADQVRVTFDGYRTYYQLYEAGGTAYGSSYSDDATFVLPAYSEEPRTYRIRVYYGYYTYSQCSYCWGGYCDDYEYVDPYEIRVDVTPNLAPYVYASGPDFAVHGETQRFTVYGTDGDGNGRRVGAEFPHASVAWKDGGFGTDPATWPVFEHAFPESGTVTFWAEDLLGARTSVARSVVVGQDDCGTRTDVDVANLALPFACHGTLWAPTGDDLDTFAFDVPAGAERLYVGYSTAPSFASGDAEVRVVGPGGLAASSVDAPLFVASPAPGAWRVEVARLAGSGSYDLSVGVAGAPAAPVLGASLSDPTPHQGQPVTLTLAAHEPNGERVSYLVDWGEGAPVRVPAVGTVPANAPQVVEHTYWTPMPDPTVVVTVVNDDGLFDDERTPLDLSWHHDCRLVRVGYDAPGARTGVVLHPPSPCHGSVGYALPGGAIDAADVYRIRHTLDEASTFEVRLETQPGLVAKVYVDWYLLGVGVARFQTSPLLNPDFVAVAAPGGDFYVTVERVSGAGAYVLTVDEEVIV